ncbi:ThiF family adenylyltransferase [Arenibaculum sp.]|uniref:ThiF family adenylyltransferase n=1 Tax=Arenibaculum sp. TaxID=2865862 RepID=UPI002E1093A0|nr:ThiF family adenylyltransferase [Arenibaculum sp.]
MVENARMLERSILGALQPEGGGVASGAPQVILPADPDARARLARFREAAGRVVDLFDPLLMEWMLVLNPHYKLDAARLEARLAEFRREYLAGREPEDAGSWVLYANGLLLHLLEPEHQYLLRTSRNIGLFTAEEQGRVRQARVAVAGLSVGGMCATTLAMEGVTRFYLTDFDKLACSNLNRLASSLSRVGVDKTDIVAEKIWDIDPFAEVVVAPNGYGPGSDGELFREGSKPDVLIDAMDSIEAKIAVREACRRHRVPVVWMMDIGDGLVQIGSERYDRDGSYPAFHGRIADMERRLARPLDYVESLLSIIDVDHLPHRFADSFDRACKSEWPGISQLAGTVSIAAGAIARTARRILMDEDVTPEFFIDVDEKADPAYGAHHASDHARTREFMKGLGLMD